MPPRRYPGTVREDLVMRAGVAPASGERGRWRQVALLATAAALGDDARVQADLAAALHGVDAPDAAVHVARAAVGDPWARWWLALAAGQSVPAREVGDEVARMASGSGPDAREVARRLADLQDELEDIAAGTGVGRFGLLGVTATAPRRALLVGRSSAAFLVAPSWDAVELIRLAPSDGPSGGNRAHLSLEEIIARIRRGERGTDRVVPPDAPVPADAARFLDGLRDDRAVRDRQLLELAEEVRQERAQLAADRANLRDRKVSGGGDPAPGGRAPVPGRGGANAAAGDSRRRRGPAGGGDDRDLRGDRACVPRPDRAVPPRPCRRSASDDPRSGGRLDRRTERRPRDAVGRRFASPPPRGSPELRRSALVVVPVGLDGQRRVRAPFVEDQLRVALGHVRQRRRDQMQGEVVARRGRRIAEFGEHRPDLILIQTRALAEDVCGGVAEIQVVIHGPRIRVGAPGRPPRASRPSATAPMDRQMPELRLTDPLPDHSRDSLTRALTALDAHTTAPLRLYGHAFDGTCEVFELHEELAPGIDGRRFLLSITATGRDALLIPLDPTIPEDT